MSPAVTLSIVRALGDSCLTGKPMQLVVILFRQHQLKSNIHGSRSYAGMPEPQRT